MQNLPNLKLLGQKASSAIAFTLLGAILMLLIGNQKASLEILIKVNEIIVKVATCHNH